MIAMVEPTEKGLSAAAYRIANVGTDGRDRKHTGFRAVTYHRLNDHIVGLGLEGKVDVTAEDYFRDITITPTGLTADEAPLYEQLLKEIDDGTFSAKYKFTIVTIERDNHCAGQKERRNGDGHGRRDRAPQLSVFGQTLAESLKPPVVEPAKQTQKTYLQAVLDPAHAPHLEQMMRYHPAFKTHEITTDGDTLTFHTTTPAERVNLYFYLTQVAARSDVPVDFDINVSAKPDTATRYIAEMAYNMHLLGKPTGMDETQKLAYEERIQQIEEARQALERQLGEKTKEHGTLSGQLEVLSRTNDSLNADLAGLRDDYTTLEGLADEAAKEGDRLRATNTQLAKDLEGVQTEYQTAQQRAEQLQGFNDRAVQANDEAVGQLQALSERNQTLESRLGSAAGLYDSNLTVTELYTRALREGQMPDLQRRLEEFYTYLKEESVTFDEAVGLVTSTDENKVQEYRTEIEQINADERGDLAIIEGMRSSATAKQAAKTGVLEDYASRRSATAELLEQEERKVQAREQKFDKISKFFDGKSIDVVVDLSFEDGQYTISATIPIPTGTEQVDRLSADVLTYTQASLSTVAVAGPYPLEAEENNGMFQYTFNVPVDAMTPREIIKIHEDWSAEMHRKSGMMLFSKLGLKLNVVSTKSSQRNLFDILYTEPKKTPRESPNKRREIPEAIAVRYEAYRKQIAPHVPDFPATMPDMYEVLKGDDWEDKLTPAAFMLGMVRGHTTRSELLKFVAGEVPSAAEALNETSGSAIAQLVKFMQKKNLIVAVDRGKYAIAKGDASE